MRSNKLIIYRGTVYYFQLATEIAPWIFTGIHDDYVTVRGECIDSQSLSYLYRIGKIHFEMIQLNYSKIP